MLPIRPSSAEHLQHLGNFKVIVNQNALYGVVVHVIVAQECSVHMISCGRSLAQMHVLYQFTYVHTSDRCVPLRSLATPFTLLLVRS